MAEQNRFLDTSEEKRESQFTVERIPSRSTLLDLALRYEPDFFNQLVGDPEGWAEELSGLHNIFTGRHLARGIGFEPRLEDENSHLLSENVAIITESDYMMQIGLWIRSNEEWQHFGIGHSASLRKHKSFSTIDSKYLLPESFEPNGQVIKDDKRPILKFSIPGANGPIGVIAKGSNVVESMYYSERKPSARKTSLAGAYMVTSAEEMNRFQVLAKKGVAVPAVIGYYESVAEQWLLVEEVRGTQIPEWLDNEEAIESIIVQDARMLAALCQVGFKKQGFTDFDDKLFDGESLYLIDTDEIIDLYYELGIDFRKLALDPNDETAVSEFRKFQREVFLKELKDAMYDYRESLLDSEQRRLLYIQHFMDVFGWQPTDEEMTYLLSLQEENYMTRDTFNSMMSDTD